MKRLFSSPIFWGAVLIIGGVLFLLDTIGVFKIGDLLWLIIAGVAGLLFLAVYVFNRIHWWALIPGVFFVALAAVIGINLYMPGATGSNLSAVVLLGGIGLSFLMVFLADRMNWWAIIPFGVMATLAVVSVMSDQSAVDTGGIFFLGLGLTFALVAVLPNKVGRMNWAWIPGGILGVIGLAILVARENLLNYVWPIALMLGGILLIIRAFRR